MENLRKEANDPTKRRLTLKQARERRKLGNIPIKREKGKRIQATSFPRVFFAYNGIKGGREEGTAKERKETW